MPRKKKGKTGPKPIFKDPATIALRVEREEYERVIRIAEQEKINASAIVRRAIRQYLEGQDRKSRRAI